MANKQKPKTADEASVLLTETEAGRVFELVPDVPEPTRAERLLGAVRQGDDVLNKPRTSWLVRNLVPTSSWGILYGPPGGGKSFYGLTFALELARGGRWAGQEIEPEKVLYIAAERAAVLGDRQEAWQRHHRQPIPGNFHELVWAPQLHKGEDLDDLVSVVAAIRPRPLTAWQPKEWWLSSIE